MTAHAVSHPPPTPWWRFRTLDTFPDLAALHQAHPERYPFLLESVAYEPSRARYDILFAFPGRRLVLESRRRLRQDGGPVAGTDFLAMLDNEWRRLAVRSDPAPDLPFTGGWFVYLGYELATEIEPSLISSVTKTPFPVACAVRVPAAIIRDRLSRKTHLVCEADSEHLLAALDRDVLDGGSVPMTALSVEKVEEDDPGRFLSGVRRIKEYIRAGDVFQVNLSRSWRIALAKDTPPVEVYRHLCQTNPAPFAGLVRLGMSTAVISSSPERLVSVRGRLVCTRPIAGTYPRSNNLHQDRNWSRELLLHPKERAEHVMLLDLERNDLGRVCETGSVAVSDFMVLESYRHVHHIVSEVTGTLRDDVTPGEVIRAVFPGGTITGCPKVRCMEIITELEQTARGAYTGSIGYINRDGSMDLNILIRTLVQDGDAVSLRAGAGIVADSVPERELGETRAKAKGLLAALGR